MARLAALCHYVLVQQEASGNEPAYDFFIAHAGPDTSAAERLFDLLNPASSVFLDSRCLEYGDDFDRSLAEAQCRSDVTVVLVSNRTGHAFYQREEIAAAIDMARSERGHRVVPVYMTPRRELGNALPYGLRLKHGIEVSELVPLEAVAEELLRLRERINASTTRLAPSDDRGVDIDALLKRDPTLAVPAVRTIIERGELPVAEVVDRLSDLNRVQIFVVRSLLSRFPAESGPLMVQRILATGSDWHSAVHVPSCLTVEHAPYCVENLVQALDSYEPDVVRLSLEGLGYLGARTWGFSIVRLLHESSEYEYEKYAHYAVGALARMVVLFDPSGFDPGSQLSLEFSRLEHLIRIIERRGWPTLTLDAVADILFHCRPRHADELVKWLGSDLPSLRELGASALGDLGMGRVIPHLVGLANSLGEDRAVRRRATFAIGSIGGKQAVRELALMLERGEGDDELGRAIRQSLAGCLADAQNNEEFELLAAVLVEDPWLAWRVYRAIGIRGDARFEDRLRRSLEAVEGVDRGAAALALARVRSTEASSELRRAYEEAVTPFERVLMVLALMTIGEIPSSDPDLTRLCADLAHDSYAYDRTVTEDIVAVMSRATHPRAVQISETWAPIYADGPNA